jgi:hypothetical protein
MKQQYPKELQRVIKQFLCAKDCCGFLMTQVFFLGKPDVRKVKGNPHLQKTNYGYDDERGDYVVTPKDHIAYR